MIRKYSVSNFGSFADGFSFSADSKDGRCNVASAVFGINGSGKSNFINSFRFLKDVVISGLREDYTNYFNKDHDLSDNVIFEIEVDFLNDTRFTYILELDVSGSGIIGESLNITQKGKNSALIKTRKNKRFIVGNPHCVDNKSVNSYTTLVELIYKSLLVEIVSGKSDGTFLRHICLFYSIILNIEIVSPDSSILNIDPEKTVRLIRSLDATSMVEVDRNIDKERILSARSGIEKKPGQIINKVRRFMDLETRDHYYYSIQGEKEDCFRFVNNGPGNNHYPFSEGQKRMLELAPMITDESDYGIYIVDELDRKLHTNLSIQLINLFMKKKNHQQLIFTTHESELIDCGLIDNDNMWLIEKELGDGSYLYSFPDRMIDSDLKKKYIEDKLLEM